MAIIRDVARAAGVSAATVSRAFATPDLISSETQKRVLAAARTLGYRPPRQRNLPHQTSETRMQRAVPGMNAIGFQFFTSTTEPDDTLAVNGFYMPVLLGAQAEASALGLHLMVHTTNRHAMPIEIPRMIQEQAIGGLLLVGSPAPGLLASIAERVPNIVLVDSHDDSETYESVVSDGFRGSMAATRYLLGLGHCRIGFFLSEDGFMSFQDRLRGYRCAMIEARMALSGDLIIGKEALSSEAQRAKLVEQLRSPNRPTAVVCSNDDAALFLQRQCREANLRVPEDISIVGFDDMPFAVNAEPPLTTVRVNKELLGQIAVRRLYDRFRNVSSTLSDHAPIRHVAPVSLIVRNSCCPLSQDSR